MGSYSGPTPHPPRRASDGSPPSPRFARRGNNGPSSVRTQSLDEALGETVQDALEARFRRRRDLAVLADRGEHLGMLGAHFGQERAFESADLLYGDGVEIA